ncbi:MAG TPA: sulfatase [Candidatus Paceibacterota bacterium]|nr:sulfatase [Verrucomicrobiota bacterium]HSA11863.1 sulfatase [Candidatus Paceibacterota bacterium]
MHARLALLLALSQTAALAATLRLNVLLITADDMGYNTPAFAGCLTPGITPNLDRLAKQGVWFVNAHVTVAVCQPSRECLMTGRYPHRNGATGFYPVRSEVPTLMESLKAAGYQLGIMAKVSHLAPPSKFPWDYSYDARELGQGRDPSLYYRSAREFFAKAKDAGKPYFLMANSQDPHRPWAGSEGEITQGQGKLARKKKAKKVAGAQANEDGIAAQATYPPPARIYKPEEVVVPGFLPDLPNVRKEMAQYYSSAHRCDETVGEILRALKDSGFEESTLVMFLSDNGISMPFGKSNCYLASTRTPWLVRWPGKVKPSTVDRDHFISGIDFMPTILEAAGVAAPANMDGRSFLPLLLGLDQPGRDRVFTCYNDTSGRRSYPMRCLQTRHCGYIYNAWSDGTTQYRAEPMGGLTFNAMQQAAMDQKDVAARVEMLLHRVPEEFYDFATDPDGLHNLIADPKCQEQVAQARKDMLSWMQRTQDPLLNTYRARLKPKPLKP